MANYSFSKEPRGLFKKKKKHNTNLKNWGI